MTIDIHADMIEALERDGYVVVGPNRTQLLDLAEGLADSADSLVESNRQLAARVRFYRRWAWAWFLIAMALLAERLLG